MGRWRDLAGAATALIASLAAGPVRAADANSFVYTPPSLTPPGTLVRHLKLPPEAALPAIVTALRGKGLRIEDSDAGRRQIVARYAGDARRYVDCGDVAMLVDGRPAVPPRRYSANRPTVRSFRLVQGKRIGLSRDFVLDARVTVRLTPHGKGTEVTVEAIYVATRSVYHVAGEGLRGILADRELISFTSSEVGRFAAGTSCVPTGHLERLPTSALSK